MPSRLFMLIPLAVLILLYVYTGKRIFGPLSLSRFWRVVAWFLLGFSIFFPIAAMAGRNFLSTQSITFSISIWLAYLFMGFASILLFVVLAKDIVWLIGLVGRKILSLSRSRSDTSLEIATSSLDRNGESRRQLIRTTASLAALGVSGMMTGCGFVQARFFIKNESVIIPIADLPAKFEGFKIAQISDVHVGPTIKRDFVEDIVANVKALKPDLIALTGDLVDDSVENLTRDVAPLAELEAPFGKYFVTGNHEYYSGVLDWVEKVPELGFEVLLNDHKILSKGDATMLLGGVTDLSAERILPDHKSDPALSLQGAPETNVKILLAHQPNSVYDAAKAGYDLQLSGHTHGGQYFPYSKLVALAQPFIEGLYQHEKTWLYVNRGTGYWGPPLRLGSPAEITSITLTRA